MSVVCPPGDSFLGQKDDFVVFCGGDELGFAVGVLLAELVADAVPLVDEVHGGSGDAPGGDHLGEGVPVVHNDLVVRLRSPHRHQVVVVNCTEAQVWSH